MTVVPVPSHGRWAVDQRGGGRAVRVSARAEAGFLVLSTWKVDECVSTVRLVPGEAAELMAGIAEGLAHLAGSPVPSPVGSPAGSPVVGAPAAAGSQDRLAVLEQRVRALEVAAPAAAADQPPA